MKSYRHFLEEAISISQYRKIFSDISKFYKDRYKDWFNGKWRVYIDLKGQNLSSNKVQPPIPKEVSQIVEKAGYKIEDYKLGIAAKGKAVIKIGKLIQKELKANPTSEDAIRANKLFVERLGGKELKSSEGDIVVISRHPYDIAGMSTGRGWKSCKHLESGSNRKYIPSEIDEGCLIAYLIKSTDTNIENPIGRIFIVPYVNISNPSDKFLFANPIIYGSGDDNFVKAVQEWLDSKQGEKAGLYCIDQEQIYPDSLSSAIIKSKKTGWSNTKDIYDFFVQSDYLDNFTQNYIKANKETVESLIGDNKYLIDYVSSATYLSYFLETYGFNSLKNYFDIKSLDLLPEVHSNSWDNAVDSTHFAVDYIINIRFNALTRPVIDKICKITGLDLSNEHDQAISDYHNDEEVPDDIIDEINSELVNAVTDYLLSYHISADFDYDRFWKSFDETYIDAIKNPIFFMSSTLERLKPSEALKAIVNGKQVLITMTEAAFKKYIEVTLEHGDSAISTQHFIGHEDIENEIEASVLSDMESFMEIDEGTIRDKIREVFGI